MAPDAISKAVREVFDLRPAAILRDLDLRRPIFAATAAYGHFGRTGEDAYLVQYLFDESMADDPLGVPVNRIAKQLEG